MLLKDLRKAIREGKLVDITGVKLHSWGTDNQLPAVLHISFDMPSVENKPIDDSLDITEVSLSTKPKYDPCRLLRKGDKAQATPSVEELEPFNIYKSDDNEYVILFEDTRVSTFPFKGDGYPYYYTQEQAKAAAEDACAQLNAEKRKKLSLRDTSNAQNSKQERSRNMSKHPYTGYNPPSEADMEMLRVKIKECVTEAKRILQQKNTIHGRYVTTYESEEIETAVNCLEAAEELFEKDAKFIKDQNNG